MLIDKMNRRTFGKLGLAAIIVGCGLIASDNISFLMNSIKNLEKKVLSGDRESKRNPIIDTKVIYSEKFPKQSSFKINVPGNSYPKMISVDIENISDRDVNNFWLWSEKIPNFYNKETWLQDVISKSTNDEEKVMAIARSIAKYSKNYWPPLLTGSELNEPSKIISWPLRKCSDHGPMLQDLCKLIEVETRFMGGVKNENNNPNGKTILGHLTSEVLINNRWRLLDVDKGAVRYLGWDNKTPVSIVDCIDKKNILLIGRTDHIYEEGNSGRVMCLYDPISNPLIFSKIEELVKENERIRKKKQNENTTFYSQYNERNEFNLRRHEKVELKWNKAKKFFWRGSCKGIIGKFWPKKFHPPDDTYANGKITFSPSLEDILMKENVKIRNSTINITNLPAYIIFSLQSPYLMLDTRISGFSSDEIEIYTYNGWSKKRIGNQACWVYESTVKKKFKLNLDSIFGDSLRHFPSELYRYFVKFQFSKEGKVELKNLCFTSTFQENPLTLPALKNGINQIKLFSDNIDDVNMKRIEYEKKGKVIKVAAESDSIKITFEFEPNYNHQPVIDENSIYPKDGQEINELNPVLRCKAYDVENDEIVRYHFQLGLAGKIFPLCTNMDKYVTEPEFPTEWVITQKELDWIGRKGGPKKGPWLNPNTKYWWRVRARDIKAEKEMLGDLYDKFQNPEWEHAKYENGYWKHLWHDKGQWGPWSKKFIFKTSNNSRFIQD